MSKAYSSFEDVSMESLEEISKSIDGIHVSVRIRPLSSNEITKGINPCCSVINDSTLLINKAGDSGAYLKSQESSSVNFAFDKVFGENATQTEVYNNTAKPYVVKALMGENVTIFAYGATGAGKNLIVCIIITNGIV
jgi:kinesin family member 18/19